MLVHLALEPGTRAGPGARSLEPRMRPTPLAAVLAAPMDVVITASLPRAAPAAERVVRTRARHAPRLIVTSRDVARP